MVLLFGKPQRLIGRVEKISDLQIDAGPESPLTRLPSLRVSIDGTTDPSASFA